MTNFKAYNSADFLRTADEIDAYIDEAFKLDDERVLSYAFDVVLRAKNISPKSALLSLAHSKELTNA